MALEHTGMIVGARNSALIIAPQSAFVLEAHCMQACGCGAIFYVAGSTWVDDVDLATIYRSIDAGELAILQAREKARGCLRDAGVTFDIKPLAGYVGR